MPVSDPLGSVNVRRSTLALIHRARMMMTEKDAPLVPLHETVRRCVIHYLDCVDGSATQKTPAHGCQKGS